MMQVLMDELVPARRGAKGTHGSTAEATARDASRSAASHRYLATTERAHDGLRAPHLVKRKFTADRPEALWVTDLERVPTRSH